MGEIWEIVLGIIAGFGGVGVIILAIIKFSAEQIARRLEEKYSLKLNKELEKYKYNLDNKIYISKTKFDTEFSIYKELSKAFFDLVKDISLLIPTGVTTKIADEKAQKEYENKLYSDAVEKAIVAQDALNSNAPFIQSDLFNKYNIIFQLCNRQLKTFERRWNVLIMASQEEKESFSTEDYNRTDEINTKFSELNEKIRTYLATLDVIE
ncbi:hypothetical protein DS742_19295 [Lacrimispora amygdalina]|uniref:Uncharacterized protein n=1 Tax=Lacrimispora amygdalina TaxID=253257 RepID=A0A3E2N8L8_9FIRM|nr:hypothetical protein [Clostridium indicum]RFZ77336.1 hypothetical protein DS742_19295 [Clostridium indicum]